MIQAGGQGQAQTDGLQPDGDRSIRRRRARHQPVAAGRVDGPADRRNTTARTAAPTMVTIAVTRTGASTAMAARRVARRGPRPPPRWSRWRADRASPAAVGQGRRGCREAVGARTARAGTISHADEGGARHRSDDEPRRRAGADLLGKAGADKCGAEHGSDGEPDGERYPPGVRADLAGHDDRADGRSGWQDQQAEQPELDPQLADDVNAEDHEAASLGGDASVGRSAASNVGLTHHRRRRGPSCPGWTAEAAAPSSLDQGGGRSAVADQDHAFHEAGLLRRVPAGDEHRPSLAWNAQEAKPIRRGVGGSGSSRRRTSGSGRSRRRRCARRRSGRRDGGAGREWRPAGSAATTHRSAARAGARRCRPAGRRARGSRTASSTVGCPAQIRRSRLARPALGDRCLGNEPRDGDQAVLGTGEAGHDPQEERGSLRIDARHQTPGHPRGSRGPRRRGPDHGRSGGALHRSPPRPGAQPAGDRRGPQRIRGRDWHGPDSTASDRTEVP